MTPSALATAGVHVISIAHHKPLPRCSGVRKQKTRKGRCMGSAPGGGLSAGSGNTYGKTYGGTIYGGMPGTIINPGPAPRIVTFGNGAGSGITTFGHSLGASSNNPNPNANSGTGPFGHLGGTTVGQ